VSEMAIVTEELSKSYGKVEAVRSLNLRVPRGAVYGFLGRNGAGKTTTMRMLMGLARPTQGFARLLGMNPENEAERVRLLERAAFLPQKKQLYPWMTPAELVRFSRSFFPQWSDEVANRTARAMEIPMGRMFRKLSHGNQTKVALLLALAQGADVLVLDEPTAGLDPVMVDEVLRMLVDEHVSEGRTIFFSSHQLEEVEQICDWVGILEQGRLLLEARLEEIRREYRLVIGSGENLPKEPFADAVAVSSEGRFCKYVVARNAEQFGAELAKQGATILEVSPLGLRELFLQLVRKEETCTPGNAGGKRETVSTLP